MKLIKLFASVFITVAYTTTFAQDGTFTSRSLTTETAIAAANAALQSCRKQGYQVAVVTCPLETYH